MNFILKTKHKNFHYWGWYVDPEEPIDIYKEEVNFESICPYNKPKPIMTIYPGSNEVIYWLSRHATRPRTKHYILINGQQRYTNFRICNEKN